VKKDKSLPDWYEPKREESSEESGDEAEDEVEETEEIDQEVDDTVVPKPESILDLIEEGSEEESELVICSQCHNAADADSRSRTTKVWVSGGDGRMGLPCTQMGGEHALHNKHRYCSSACLVSHFAGLTPPPRPVEVERYLQTKLASTLQVLLLSRGCDFDAVLNDGTRAPDMSRSAMEVLAEEWRELKEKTRKEPSPSLRKLAHLFESLLTKNLRDKIAFIPKDAMDRERKIFHLKATTVLAHRVVMDTADPKLSSVKVKSRSVIWTESGTSCRNRKRMVFQRALSRLLGSEEQSRLERAWRLRKRERTPTGAGMYTKERTGLNALLVFVSGTL